MVKIFIIGMLIAILYNLGHALYFLIYKKKNNVDMVRALTWRIGLSMLLFMILMTGFLTGIIHPHHL